MYNMQNFFYFFYQWLFYLDYWYINRYLYLNWFMRVQFYLLKYCKCYLYLFLNIYVSKGVRFITKRENYFIISYLNILFLKRVLRAHYLFWNLLFIIMLSQLGSCMYYFQQYFSYNVSVYCKWLNILYIV
jgi:hypothetical protein